jgi:hypothetical protein
MVKKLKLKFKINKGGKFISGGKDIENEAFKGGLNIFSNLLKIVGKNNNNHNNINNKYKLVKASESKNLFK